MKYRFGPFIFDARERLLTRDGENVPLTPKASDTLAVLLERPGRLVSKDELLERVWPGTFVEESTLAQNISTLRKAVGAGAIETLPRRGYRFTGEVVVIGDDAIHTAPARVEESIRPKRSRRAPRAAGIGLGIAAVLLTATGFLAWTAKRNPAPVASGPRTLVILPFRNLQPGSEWDFIGPSLAEAVAGRLSLVPQIVVRPSAYAAIYGGTDADPEKAAEAMKADTVLAATYLTDGQRLRVHAELLDVERSARVWSETIDLPYDRLMTLQDRVADRIAQALGLQLSREARRARQDAPRDPVAYEYYLRGITLNERNEWRPAIALLSESVSREATNAAAWAELGVSYYGYGAFQSGGPTYVRKGLEAFEQSLALRPELLEARLSLVMYWIETGELEAAAANVREVLRLNPNYPFAHFWLSQIYRYAGLLDESLEAVERATQLDPHVARGSTHNTYLYAGRAGDFLRTLPDDGSARTMFYRGLGHLYQGATQEAVLAFDRAFEKDPALLHARIGRAMRFGVTGPHEQGVALLRTIPTDGIPDGEMLYKIAQAYALAGRNDMALRLLARAIDQDFFCAPYIERDALLASLRGDARYTEVVQRARARMQAFREAYLADSVNAR